MKRPFQKVSGSRNDVKNFVDDVKYLGKKAWIYMGAGILIAPLISGLFSQWLYSCFHRRGKIVIMNSYIVAFSGVTKYLTLLCLAGWIVGGWKMYRRFQHDYKIDEDDGDFETMNSGEYGRSHFQTETERKENFLYSKDPLHLKSNILGKDDNGYLYSFSQKKLPGSNRNDVTFGPAGSGKTDCKVKPDFYQYVNAGDSVVLVDSKGDVFKDTKHFLNKRKTHEIRVLNCKPKELKNSDSFDFLCELKKAIDDEAAGRPDAGDPDSIAQQLANVTIANTSVHGPGGKKGESYWPDNEMNLLKALLLLVATRPKYRQTGEANFSKVYDLLAANPVPDDLAKEFYGFDKTSNIMQAFGIFWSAGTNRDKIINGLAIRLSIFANKYVRKIVSSHDMDPILPMKKPCVYYIILSDRDDTYSVLSSLFFQVTITEMVDYADSLNKKQRTSKIPVHLILDEYYSIGGVDKMEKIISTVRSREITISIIIQDLPQIMELHPTTYDTLLGNATCKILLACNDKQTAEYWSFLLGTKTMRIDNKRTSRRSDDILEGNDEYTSSSGLGERELRKPAELINEMSENEVIIHVSKRFPLLLKKYFSAEHPFDPIAKEKEIMPRKYIPFWRRREIEKEKKGQEILKKAAARKEIEENNEPVIEKETQSKPLKSKKDKTAKVKPATKAEAMVSDIEEKAPVEEMQNDDNWDDTFDHETGEIYEEYIDKKQPEPVVEKAEEKKEKKQKLSKDQKELKKRIREESTSSFGIENFMNKDNQAKNRLRGKFEG